MMFNGNRIIVRYSFMRGFAIKIMAFLVVAAITSCNDTLDQSLELAGDNRQELEKVLAYFEDDEDPLKYEAACFLIENMPYHYAPKGENVDYVDSVYLAMSEYPKEQREKVFKELLKAKDLPNGRPAKRLEKDHKAGVSFVASKQDTQHERLETGSRNS